MPDEVIGFGYMLVAAGVFSLLAIRLKQPVIPAYILAGVIVGPVLGLVTEPHVIGRVSEITIIFVMFVVGMEMNVKRIRAVGLVVSLGGVLQVVLTSLVGFLIVWPFFGLLAGICVGIAFSFGSTMVVIKDLSDRKRLDSLSGRITIGILLVQDLMALIAASVLVSNQISANALTSMLLKTAGLVGLAIVAGQLVFPIVYRWIARNAELMLITSMAVCFAFVFIAHSQGVAPSMGAFITGVSLANLPYSLEIIGRIKALRDFFMPIFFAALGLQLVPPSLGMVVPILLLVVASITIKPLLTTGLVTWFGHQRRTGFGVGLSMVPTSEFGLVIVALGVTLGHYSQDLMTLAIVLMTITMVAHAYMVNGRLYDRVRPMMERMFRSVRHKTTAEDTMGHDGAEFDVVLIGCHRVGRYLLESAEEAGLVVHVLEIDPDRLKTLKDKGVHCDFGDAYDSTVWDELGDLNDKWIICAAGSPALNSRLLQFVSDRWPKARLVLTADDPVDALELYSGEPSPEYVICAHSIAGQALKEGDIPIFGKGHDLAKEKKNAIKHLEGVVRGWSMASN